MLTLDPESIETAVAERAFTGVVTVDSADERIFERARGFAHRAFEVPNTVDTQFGIASGSKAFTALAIMRLVEDGALSLDTRAREVLGTDLPEIDDAVTIEHLLTHTSGIGDYLDEEAEWEPSDYVLAAPVHTLTTAEAFLPLVDGFRAELRPRRALGVLQRQLRRARDHPRAGDRGGLPRRRAAPRVRAGGPAGAPTSCDWMSCPARRRSATSSTRATGSTR